MIENHKWHWRFPFNLNRDWFNFYTSTTLVYISVDCKWLALMIDHWKWFKVYDFNLKITRINMIATIVHCILIHCHDSWAICVHFWPEWECCAIKKRSKQLQLIHTVQMNGIQKPTEVNKHLSKLINFATQLSSAPPLFPSLISDSMQLSAINYFFIALNGL